jgi:serine/threonine protein kinase
MAARHEQLLGGRYRLQALLGQGGMGIVWHAHDDLLDRDVAVKEVQWPPELNSSEQELLFQRTVREARAAARLNHPAAVTVFDVVEERGRPWIVMEFVRSRSLAQAVEDDGPLPPSQVAWIGLQVLGALAAAHAVGIMHRDVKPGNVLLAEDNRVVLTDFGIAALHGDATLTASGVLMGSPAYIAPERARGGPAEPASDLWSLGVTLYAAVEGRTPYERGGAMPTLLAVTTEAPDPPQRAGPLVPVLEGLLRRDPASRLSGDDVGRLLREVAAGPGAGTRLAGPPPATQPNLARGERTRVLRVPGSAADQLTADDQPSTVLAAVPPVTSRPPIPAPAGPGDPGPEAPRRRYLPLLLALAGLVAVAVIAAVLLLPGHTGSGHHPPATSPSSTPSAGPTGASSAGAPSTASRGSAGPTSPGSAAASSVGSSAPSTAPSSAPSTASQTPPPTASAQAPSPAS